MADEQIIYLSPEEDLTGVRERLQRIEARRIILVIPAQTQLRSHVSWRLLHARARELNKEILIISSDRQIRSVVKAAGFKVADSLESSPTGRTRPGSRPSRTGLRGRTAASLRTPPGKTLPGQQAGEPRLRPSYQPPRQYFNEPAVQPDREARKDEASEEEDTLEIAPPAPATFGMDEKQFAPGFDYRIGSSASIRPVVPSYEDEDPNQLLEDYRQAQSIRQAAANKQKNDADAMMPPENVAPSKAMPHTYDSPSTSRDAEEPFTYLEEIPSSPLPEQRASIPTASMPMHELDDSATDTAWGAGNPPDRDPDVADYPTDVLRVEDQGDQGDIVDRSGSLPGSWGMPALDEEHDMPGPSRVHGVRPRTNRTGQVPSPQPQSDIDDDNALPPVYDQQTRIPPPPVRRPSGTFSPPPAERSPRQESQAELVKPSPAGTGNRPPQPVSLPQPRAQARTAQPPLKKRPASGRPPTGAIARPARQPAGSQSQQAGKKRVSRGGAAMPILVVALILLLIGLLAFLLPSADVTVTLPSHSFPLPMKLTATANSRLDAARKTIPAQTLVFNTSVTGPGHATGSTLVGTKSATGEVVFTNTGSSPIIIPTGTIFATQSGVQFTTTAEALASPNNSTIPAPVQAQNPGQSGNVPASAINTIPSSSQSSILQANPGLAAVTLEVTNPAPTTGGGAGSATSVSSNDVNAEKATLDVLLQAQIKDFLKKNLLADDQRGNLIETETPIATPAVGQVATDGTFMETLKLNMKVLVVRAADLQTAAAAELKDALNRQKSGLALLPQQGVTLTQLKNVPSKDGNSLTLSFTAVGQVVPQISEDTVRNLVFGKTIDDAKRILAGPGGIPNVQDAQITVYPGFFQRLPYWQQRINVHFKARPAPTPKHGKS